MDAGVVGEALALRKVVPCRGRPYLQLRHRLVGEDLAIAKWQREIIHARELSESGLHAEVVQYLGGRPRRFLKSSPTLCLLYGTAQARLGRIQIGTAWVEDAITRARKQGERAVETRALNARGAIAFVSGKIDDAADLFTQCLMAASRDDDHATIGRCSNNLGSINNLRGRHAEAIGSYTIAIAAFDRAGLPRGVAECRHNLGIAYCAQGDLEKASAEASRAVQLAGQAGDQSLAAMTIRGHAEIQLRCGELEAAEHEIERALSRHKAVGDVVEEAEDLRVVAAIESQRGDNAAAEKTLLDVIARAESYHASLLLGDARRDLAHLLQAIGRESEAFDHASAAIAEYDRLGAVHEVRDLERHDWVQPMTSRLRRSIQPLQRAQRMADDGRYPELVQYLAELAEQEVTQSPTLAHLNGIGYARIGQLDTARRWVELALDLAQSLGDRTIEVRALNTCGAIALELGGIDEAVKFFKRAQTEALRDGDLTTVGRCANNMGIISNMRGEHSQAIGHLTAAAAAYQRARWGRGVAEAQHNLGIAYRDQGNLRLAIQAADVAVDYAERLGAAALKAQALAGRAEIRVLSGDPAVARCEVEHALRLHRELGDLVLEAEDLRILALALIPAGEVRRAERLLRDIIDRATDHKRPLLAATAQRDLARLQQKDGRPIEARATALKAREDFESLSALGAVTQLDVLLAEVEASCTAS